MSLHNGSASERANDWRTKAACLGRWDEMHPDNDTNEIAAARAVCAGCPTAIARACFWDAVRVGDMEWGVRAGLRANERRAVVKELKRRRMERAAADQELAA